MFIEKLPSKLTIARDLNAAGYIVQEGETPANQKNFILPMFKATEVINVDDEDRVALISDVQNKLYGFVYNVINEIFGDEGVSYGKAVTEWRAEE